jgi:hypothetical protein
VQVYSRYSIYAVLLETCSSSHHVAHATVLCTYTHMRRNLGVSLVATNVGASLRRACLN